MAVITTTTGLTFGTFGVRQAANPTTASMNASNTNGGIAFPFIADKTMTVTQISSLISSVGTTFAPVLTVGIQADSGSGVPSGTFLTNGSATLAANTLTTSTPAGWYDITLPGANITQGSNYWIVWSFSGTSTGTVNFFTGYIGGASTTQNVIYGLGYATRLAAVFSKATGSRGVPVMYGDGTNYYGQPDNPTGVVSTATLNNNDRLGFRFTVPSGHPDILIDRVTIGITPPGLSAGANWKCQIFTDVATPVLIADLSSIDGNNVAGVSSTTNSTVFTSSTTQWLTSGTSYILMVGFDVTPASIPTRAHFTTGSLNRNKVIGYYGGDFIYNWQGAGTWFVANPTENIPWSITAASIRYDDAGGGGGGGFANASYGFGGIGGN